MDVLIVGGGVIGCAVALRLAQKKAHVTVLERALPGAEASSAAAGILGAQAESERPGPFLELCLASRAAYADFAAEVESRSGMGVGHRRCGLIELAHHPAEVAALERTCAWQREAGMKVEPLGPGELRRLEPALSTEALAAAHFPDDAQIDNRLLVRALTLAASSAGVEFRGGHARRVVEEAGRAVGVEVDDEVLRADAVVVAAGAWTSLLEGLGAVAEAVRPARGQMVCLQTRTPVLSRVIFGHGRYLVPRADGRVICGSTMEHGGFDKVVSAEGISGILADALRLCPALKKARFVECWAGLRPYTPDGLPILGEGPLPGSFLASGHFRNGILLTPITAELLAQAVLGLPLSLDLRPFSWNRPTLRAPQNPQVVAKKATVPI